MPDSYEINSVPYDSEGTFVDDMIRTFRSPLEDSMREKAAEAENKRLELKARSTWRYIVSIILAIIIIAFFVSFLYLSIRTAKLSLVRMVVVVCAIALMVWSCYWLGLF